MIEPLELLDLARQVVDATAWLFDRQREAGNEAAERSERNAFEIGRDYERDQQRA